MDSGRSNRGHARHSMDGLGSGAAALTFSRICTLQKVIVRGRSFAVDQNDDIYFNMSVDAHDRVVGHFSFYIHGARQIKLRVADVEQVNVPYPNDIPPNATSVSLTFGTRNVPLPLRPADASFAAHRDSLVELEFHIANNTSAQLLLEFFMKAKAKGTCLTITRGTTSSAVSAVSDAIRPTFREPAPHVEKVLPAPTLRSPANGKMQAVPSAKLKRPGSPLAPANVSGLSRRAIEAAQYNAHKASSSSSQCVPTAASRLRFSSSQFMEGSPALTAGSHLRSLNDATSSRVGKGDESKHKRKETCTKKDALSDTETGSLGGTRGGEKMSKRKRSVSLGGKSSNSVEVVVLSSDDDDDVDVDRDRDLDHDRDEGNTGDASNAGNDGNDSNSSAKQQHRRGTAKPSSRTGSRNHERTAETVDMLEDDEELDKLPLGVKYNVDLRGSDMRRTRPGEFLNDNLIDMYLAFLKAVLESRSPEYAKSIHFFSTHFFTAPTERQDAFVRKVELAQKSILVIPLHQKSLHWSLAIVLNPSQASMDGCCCMILFLDSMPSNKNSFTLAARKITDFLRRKIPAADAGLAEDAIVLPLSSRRIVRYERVRVPEQSNGSDCGAFLLTFVEFLVTDLMDLGTTAVLSKWSNTELSFGVDWFNAQRLIPMMRDRLKAMCMDTFQEREPPMLPLVLEEFAALRERIQDDRKKANKKSRKTRNIQIDSDDDQLKVAMVEHKEAEDQSTTGSPTVIRVSEPEPALTDETYDGEQKLSNKEDHRTVIDDDKCRDQRRKQDDCSAVADVKEDVFDTSSDSDDNDNDNDNDDDDDDNDDDDDDHEDDVDGGVDKHGESSESAGRIMDVLIDAAAEDAPVAVDDSQTESKAQSGSVNVFEIEDS
eukprot:ANDGO_03519.mRNA.1 Ubiquitin-like-specific protease 2